MATKKKFYGKDFQKKMEELKGGHKGVELTKGNRLPHGYEIVKGADKNHDYSQGKKKVVGLKKGYRLAHGYVATKGSKYKKYKEGGVLWEASDISNAKYLGIIEFQDNEEEFHNFEVMETEDRLIFGGMTNSGFIESGYIEKDGFSTDEVLQELVSDLETYYNDGEQYTSMIVFNERMAKGGVAGDIYSIKNPEQFKQIITIYNDLSDKTDLIKGYYIDHTDNSIVFLTPPNISDVGKDKIYDYVELLKKKGFSVINFDKSIDTKKHEFGLHWGYEKSSQWFKLYLIDTIKYAKGGNFGEENSEMVANQNKAIKHHTEELKKILDSGIQAPAWVVAKVGRAANDLSDVTHYLDGEKMANGGGVEFYSVDSETEKRAGLSTGSYNIFKNGDAFKNELKKYFLKENINNLSEGKVTIQPGNWKRLTFKSTKGFNKKTVEDIFKPIIDRFEKVYSYKLQLNDFKDKSFVLEFNNKMETGGGVGYEILDDLKYDSFAKGSTIHSGMSKLKLEIIDTTRGKESLNRIFDAISLANKNGCDLEIIDKTGHDSDGHGSINSVYVFSEKSFAITVREFNTILNNNGIYNIHISPTKYYSEPDFLDTLRGMSKGGNMDSDEKMFCDSIKNRFIEKENPTNEELKKAIQQNMDTYSDEGKAIAKSVLSKI